MIRQQPPMQVFRSGVGLLAGILLSGHIPAHAGLGNVDDPKPVPNDPRVIRDLIQRLGDDSYQARETAHRRLATVGGGALELLREAARNSPDAEVRRRADRLARDIQKALLREVRRCEKHVPGVFPWATRVVVCPRGRQAVSAGCDGLRCWDLATGKQAIFFGAINAGGYWSLALSADGKRVIAGGSDRVVRVFDVETGKPIQQFLGHQGEVWGAVLSPDGARAVTGGWDRTLCVWDVRTGKRLASFPHVPDSVRCLALSPNGRWLAAGHFAQANGPGTVRLWDVATGKELRAFRGHTLEVTSVVFSQDGTRLLTSSFDKTVRLWDVARGEECQRFVGHTGRVEGAAFTSDERRIVSCGDQTDSTLRVWEVVSGKLLLQSEPVGEGFLGLAPLPDAHQCVTASKDGVVRLWRWTY
jgi:WD40 repeat protein